VRRVYQLAEFISGKENITANILHRWIPDSDKFVEHNTSMTFLEEVSRHTGMSDKQIKDALKEKKEVFNWAIKNKLTDLKSMGKIMNLYYTDKEELHSVMKHNKIRRIKEEKKKPVLELKEDLEGENKIEHQAPEKKNPLDVKHETEHKVPEKKNFLGKKKVKKKAKKEKKKKNKKEELVAPKKVEKEPKIQKKDGLESFDRSRFTTAKKEKEI